MFLMFDVVVVVVVVVDPMMNILSADHECPPPKLLVALYYYFLNEIDILVWNGIVLYCVPRILTFCTCIDNFFTKLVFFLNPINRDRIKSN